MTDAAAIVAQALVGSAMPSSIEDARAWLADAEQHRVHVLLAERWLPLTGGDPILAALRDTLREILRAAVVVDAIRGAECRRVYAALSRQRVHAAVIKGAALAHTIYSAPHLRPRCDTDILIDRCDAAVVARTLADLGYAAEVETSGDLVTFQSHFTRTDVSGVPHAWDVHWRVSNAHAVADILNLEQIEVVGLRPPAFEGLVIPSAAHALLLACVHRVAHHHDGPDLIWLYDIHLLAESLSASDWAAFEIHAKACGAWPSCARSLMLTRRQFATVTPLHIADVDARQAVGQFAAAAGWREVDVLRMNLRALPSWSERLQLLREHLFPPAAFIAAKYHVAHRAALPWAYLRRIAAGAPKWFRRHDAA